MEVTHIVGDVRGWAAGVLGDVVTVERMGDTALVATPGEDGPDDLFLVEAVNHSYGGAELSVCHDDSGVSVRLEAHDDFVPALFERVAHELVLSACRARLVKEY